MRTLNFAVNGQKLSKDGDFDNIIRGTKGYLECSFTFDGTDWSGCKAVAVFKGKDIEYFAPINSYGQCSIPNEVTDLLSFKLHIVGSRDNYTIITNKILISQEG